MQVITRYVAPATTAAVVGFATTSRRGSKTKQWSGIRSSRQFQENQRPADESQGSALLHAVIDLFVAMCNDGENDRGTWRDQ